MSAFDNREKVCVIGSDSKIGRALFKKYAESGELVCGTSRRASVSNDHVYTLDLSSESIECCTLPKASTVFLCAYITSISQCESDVSASAINIDGISKVATHYLSKGSFVIFLSSNAVFSQNQLFPDEFEIPDPKNSYGRQKYAVEEKLSKIAASTPGSLAIVRMTKVLAHDLPLFQNWIDAVAKGEIIEPFEDVNICPISLSFVVDSLKKIASMRREGIFHLSSEFEISYLDIAKKIVEICGFSPSRVNGRSRGEGYIGVYHGHRLSMKLTQKLINIYPENWGSIIENVISPLKNKNY